MRDARLRRALLAACALCCVPFAHAQVSGSVGVVSDYRYRGYSLSDGEPAVQASVAYDAASGAYAGVFASSARYADATGVQWLPYAGIARRDAQGRSWDVGVRVSHFSGDADYDYLEAHVGLAFRRFAIRAHYAPDYFGQVSNAYFEIDGSVPMGERVRFLWHAGVARSGEGEAVYYYDPDPDPYGGHDPGYYRQRDGDRTRVDVRTGVSITTRACDVQLTWQRVDGGDAAAYTVPWNPNDRAGWVLGCARRW